MKKNITKLLLLVFLLRTIFQVGFYENSFAVTNNWDFTVPANYTLSNSLSFNITWWVANLNQTALAHTWKINNATTYNWAYDVVVDWNYAYMTNMLRDSVSIINISNPAVPTFVSEIVNNAWTIRLDWASWIVKDWNYLYIASNVSDALQIIDVSNPTAPVQVWQVFNATTLNWARWIVKSWNYVYIACDVYDALQVINVTNPAAPTIAWTIRNTTTLNWARDVKISWNYAYVSVYDWDRLTVVDISVPTAPVVSANLADATNLNWAHHVEISWNYAYVSAYLNNSVRVINITNPLAPTAVTNISGWSYSLTNPRDLLVDNNRLFITSYWSSAVNVADITNPASPVYVTKILHNVANPLLSNVDWIFKVGNLIYTAVYTSDALEILKFNYDTTWPSITPNTAYSYTWTIDSMSETLWWTNQGNITYQLSKNNWTTWYYYNWATWVSTVLWTANSNSTWTINTNIAWFNELGWWTWQFKWKAFFNSNWDQKVELTWVSIFLDKEAPVISSTNIASWSLMPWWNFDLSFNYSDVWVWVNISSDNIALYKWDWISSWLSNISATKLNLWWKVVTTTWATYPTNNLDFWKYKADFSISDIRWNTWSTSLVFYVDQPEIIVSTWSLNIWTLIVGSNKFSTDEITVTVNTVWAPFNIIMNKTSMIENNSFELIDYNWSKWVWYDDFPYTSTITKVNTNEVLWTQTWSININWLRNTYTYKIKMWAFIDNLQAWWNYQTNLSFWINLDY